MASDTGRELPSPEKVLTSLKSSGIFDEFRKSCMASVELESVYQQQAEYLRQSGEDYLSKESMASSTTKNDMRNGLRGHIIKELSRPKVQKNLEDMITEVIKRREDEISDIISDAIHKLTKAEERTETPNTDPPSSSQVASIDSLSKKAPKETALELLNAFGVSPTDTRKKGSKEGGVGSSKVRANISGETKRASSGGKNRVVPPGLSQVKPVADPAVQGLDEKETGHSSYTARSQKQHHLRLSSSDESGSGDDKESDSQSPLGEPEHTSKKSTHESELSVQSQSRKKRSETKMESPHTATVAASATKPATIDSRDGPDNPRLAVAGPHHSSTRHSLKRQFGSTEMAAKDGSSLQDQVKRKKYVHEDVVEEEHVTEPEYAKTGDESSRRGSSRKQKMVMITRSQSTKSRKN